MLKTTKPRTRRSVQLDLEILEERCCPSGISNPPIHQLLNTWKPTQGNNFGTPANWTSGKVPSAANGGANFNAQISNAPCTINVDPETTFNLVNGYTGQFTLPAGQLCTLTGFTDQNPGVNNF